MKIKEVIIGTLGLMLLIVIGTLLFAGSNRSGQVDGNANLEAHIKHVFSDISSIKNDQVKADVQRVRDVHAIADLIEKFHEKEGRYPLSLLGNSGVVIRNSKSRHGEPREDKFNVGMKVFLKELRSVLGNDVNVPVDMVKAPEFGYMDYAYSLYGGEYGVSAYLYNPAKFAQTFSPHMHQYRVGSTESIVGRPVLKYSKVLEGRYLPKGE